MPDSSLTIATDCIARRVRMLNRRVTNLYDEGLRPLGLKVSQVTILVAAWKMGTARPAAVCDALQMDVSTLSRNVDRMRARGWLETMPDPDGRAQPFGLTAEGRALLEQVLPVWQACQAKALALMGQDTVDRLDEAVRRLVAQAP
ncbi:MarR family winged helix-turn-helix transcriptional regulator [Methyloterricola oryzae]|uniref:MarR family winged helix-turn-helix transcriptional regulator n=1 Tax=Methyloterricola oryzae TaxID=1495050 RepID=UPI0005EB3462|nr:MarR family winged helix-turn-helix transcriptional regulator [Methyloterricola oryzae]